MEKLIEITLNKMIESGNIFNVEGSYTKGLSIDDFKFQIEENDSKYVLFTNIYNVCFYTDLLAFFGVENQIQKLFIESDPNKLGRKFVVIKK